MQYGSAVLDGLSAQPLLGHGVINLLDVRAAQSLQLDGADLRLDVILYRQRRLALPVCCLRDLIISTADVRNLLRIFTEESQGRHDITYSASGEIKTTPRALRCGC